MKNQTDSPFRFRWAADGRNEDDSPVVVIADDPRALRLLGVSGAIPENEVERWCCVRFHLHRWLQSPKRIDALMDEPLAILPQTSGSPTFSDVRMPRVLANLLHQHDVHPAAFAATAAWRHGAWDIVLGNVAMQIKVAADYAGDAPRITATCQPPGIVMFDMADHQLAIEQRIPVAALTRTVGGLISDVFSHPFTDPLGLILADHHEWIGDVLVYRDNDIKIRDMR